MSLLETANALCLHKSDYSDCCFDSAVLYGNYAHLAGQVFPVHSLWATFWSVFQPSNQTDPFPTPRVAALHAESPLSKPISINSA